MDFGVAIFSTHDAIASADVARLAEELGHRSLFFPEHTHPGQPAIPYPGAASCRADKRTPSTSSSYLLERVEAMKAIWMSDEASYPGEHIAFDRIWSWPKPATTGSPSSGVRFRRRLYGSQTFTRFLMPEGRSAPTSSASTRSPGSGSSPRHLPRRTS